MKGRQSLFKMSGNLYRMLVWDLVRTGGTLEVDMQEWKRICIQMDIFDAINPEEFLSSCTSIQYRSIDNSRFAMKLQLNFGYCPAYIKTDGCKNRSCNNLHCCLHFLLNECKYGSRCKFSHNLKDNHNILILGENFMEDLSNKQLVEILKLRNLIPVRPLICKGYNSLVGCKFGTECTCLHLCGHYITDDCSYGRNCKKSHDLKDLKVQDILEKRGIKAKQSCKEILNEIRKRSGCRQNNERKHATSCDMSTSLTRLSINDQEQSNEKLLNDSQLICTFFLRNKCLYKENCTKFHQPDHLPYHWQYLNNKGMWLDLPLNKDIERNYCICEDHVKIPMGSIQITLDLNDMTWSDPTSNNGKIRRLSTEHQKDASKGFLFLTVWKWFWMKDGVWITYDAEDGYPSSEIIEEVFQKKPIYQIQFVANHWNYKIDLEKMIQINKQSGKLRHMRRRPDIFNEETKLPKSVSNMVKREENNSSDETMAVSSGLESLYTLLDVLSVEFRDIQKIFSESIPMKTLKKIENSQLRKCFTVKKHSLKNKGEVHWREKFLFYGTQSQSVEAICCRGFNTDLLNSKGISFSEDASFFLDDPGCDRIFLAKVIIREFIEPSHTRSPPANSENEDIHSLFFNDLRPSIYVIYDNSQAYPEYLIEF